MIGSPPGSPPAEEEGSDPSCSRVLLGRHLSRSTGPTFFFPEFFEATSVAVAFPDLPWVPLIYAWTGYPGWQCGLASSDVAARVLDLGTSDPSLSSLGTGGLRSLSWPGWKVRDVLLRFRTPVPGEVYSRAVLSRQNFKIQGYS